MARLLVFILISNSLRSEAAYRAYKHRVFVYEGRRIYNAYYVLSNLDSQQYQNYHAGMGNIKVVNVDSWYCGGDTNGFRKYCAKPRVKRTPPSLERPKRVEIPFEFQPVIP